MNLCHTLIGLILLGYFYKKLFKNHPSNSIYFSKSRHTVMCQRPRKQKKTCSTQVCYLLVPQSCQIQHSVSPKLLSRFLPNFYNLCLTYTLLHISKLKEIALAVLEIFVSKIARFSSHFSSSHKITNTFKSHKSNLPMF